MYHDRDSALEAIRAGLSPDELGQLAELGEAVKESAGLERDGAQRKFLYRPDDFSDAGNAEIFVCFVAGRLEFCDALGWMAYDGRRWQPDDCGATALAADFTKRQLNEALAAFNEAVRAEDTDAQRAAKAYLRHAQTSRSAVAIRRMLELAKAALHHRLAEYDAEPFALNKPAGVLDLRTGEMYPHDPEQRCTKLTACSPSGDGAELWDDFLDAVTCSDGSLRGFLQLCAGMALIGRVYREGIVIAYGAGRNGKSSLFNTLAHVLGDYARSIDADTLICDRGSGSSNRGATLATLPGVRLALAGELEEGRRLSVSMLKRLCSTDDVVCEAKFRQPESFTPSHTLLMYTNFLPKVSSLDAGTWRWLIVIPFRARFEGGAAIPNYAEKLFSEAGGAVLSWAVEGARNFVRNGFRLDLPEIVENEIDCYRSAEDWLSAFLAARCRCGKAEQIGAQALYLAYRGFAEQNGEYPRRQNDFSTELEARGFVRVILHGRHFWNGLTLSAGASQWDDAQGAAAG